MAFDYHVRAINYSNKLKFIGLTLVCEYYVDERPKDDIPSKGWDINFPKPRPGASSTCMEVMHKRITVKVGGKRNAQKVCKKQVNFSKTGGEIFESRGK